MVVTSNLSFDVDFGWQIFKIQTSQCYSVPLGEISHYFPIQNPLIASPSSEQTPKAFQCHKDALWSLILLYLWTHILEFSPWPALLLTHWSISPPPASMLTSFGLWSFFPYFLLQDLLPHPLGSCWDGTFLSCPSKAVLLYILPSLSLIFLHRTWYRMMYHIPLMCCSLSSVSLLWNVSTIIRGVLCN